MADGGAPIQTIPNLPVAISLAGPEQLWVNQAGVDVRTTIAGIADYVENQIGLAGPVVTSFNGRGGAVVLTSADVAATGYGQGTFVPLTGAATVTGPFTFSPAFGRSAFIVLNKAASGPYDYIMGQTAGLDRWQLVLGDGAPESGSNTGSNFDLFAYADDGQTLLGNWLSINRATGVVTLTALQGAGAGAVIDNCIIDAGTF